MTNSDRLIPETIEMRALAHMEKGIEPIEAVRLAIEEENNTIWLAMEGLDMKTGQIKRGVKEAIQSTICKSVYNRLNNKQQ